VKSFKFVFGGGLVLSVAALSMASSASEELRTFLRKLEPQICKAFANEDVKFFAAISTDDFTYTDSKGVTQNKKQSLEGMKQMFGMSSNVKAKFSLGTVSAKGNAGTAKYLGHFTMDVAGPNGKPQKMEMHTFTNETYKKVGSKWYVQKIVEYKEGKMTMNGKPFDPSKMAPPPSKPAPVKKGIG
jgi:ketosteroid isomerase-like protein